MYKLGFKIDEIRKVVGSKILTVKRRDVHIVVSVDTSPKLYLSKMYFRTRWSSSYDMIPSAYQIRGVLKSMIARILEQDDLNFIEAG